MYCGVAKRLVHWWLMLDTFIAINITAIIKLCQGSRVSSVLSSQGQRSRSYTPTSIRLIAQLRYATVHDTLRGKIVSKSVEQFSVIVRNVLFRKICEQLSSQRSTWSVCNYLPCSQYSYEVMSMLTVVFRFCEDRHTDTRSVHWRSVIAVCYNSRCVEWVNGAYMLADVSARRLSSGHRRLIKRSCLRPVLSCSTPDHITSVSHWSPPAPLALPPSSWFVIRPSSHAAYGWHMWCVGRCYEENSDQYDAMRNLRTENEIELHRRAARKHRLFGYIRRLK